MLLSCTLTDSFVYGMMLMYRDFGLQFSGDGVSFHAAYWDVDPLPAILTACWDTGCDRYPVDIPAYFHQTHYPLKVRESCSHVQVRIDALDGMSAQKRFKLDDIQAV